MLRRCPSDRQTRRRSMCRSAWWYGDLLPGGIGPDDVVSALSARMLARMRAEPGLERRIENGRPPGENPRGPLARAARLVLQQLGVAS